MGYNASRRHCMSKAAVTHTFRKLKTQSRCRECDSYVYFQGAECIEVSSELDLIYSEGKINSIVFCSAGWGVIKSV